MIERLLKALQFGIKALELAIQRTRRHLLLVTVFALAMSGAVPPPAHAQVGGHVAALNASNRKGCFKITGRTVNPSSELYTDIEEIVGPWQGAIDAAGKGAYPMTVYISSFTPEETLLASNVASMDDMGAKGVGGYSPEQVLFRCSPDARDSIYEFFSTNGDNNFAGGVDVSWPSNVPDTYRFSIPNIVSRVTNVTNGQAVRSKWQSRQMTDLDRDSQGWYLVKVKNFSRYRIELFKCTALCGSEQRNDGQPLAYVAFKGGATGNIINNGLRAGDEHRANITGWYGTWPGAIHAYGALTVKEATPTCSAVNATPFVRFPSMTAAELNGGDWRRNLITIQFRCDRGFSRTLSGTQAGRTAIGLLVPQANAQSAINAGLKSEGNGVRYLLSDGYGTDPGVAKGVGVMLRRMDPSILPLNFLTDRSVKQGGTRDGWEPVLDDAALVREDASGVYYERQFEVLFKAFASRVTPVTAGRFNATAQVVIQIQ